jgi:hypothetical protein
LINTGAETIEADSLPQAGFEHGLRRLRADGGEENSMPTPRRRTARTSRGRSVSDIHRLVSWFLMGGCGAVHQSKPPREKIVLDLNLPSSWVSPILPRRKLFLP